MSIITVAAAARLTSRPAPKRSDNAPPERLQAHCDACGHNWKIAQHDRFVCPYCYNEPTQVDFKGSYVVLADEASRRWFA